MAGMSGTPTRSEDNHDNGLRPLLPRSGDRRPTFENTIEVGAPAPFFSGSDLFPKLVEKLLHGGQPDRGLGVRAPGR
jgi:hypothetical protein